MSVIIYHNPRCSKSRQTLEILKENGIDPTVVEYLSDTPGADELKRIIRMLGISPRDLMRTKEASEAGLNDANLSDDQLVAGMVENPSVIERPIVVAGEKAAIGRPPENVLEILP